MIQKIETHDEYRLKYWVTVSRPDTVSYSGISAIEPFYNHLEWCEYQFGSSNWDSWEFIGKFIDFRFNVTDYRDTMVFKFANESDRSYFILRFA